MRRAALAAVALTLGAGCTHLAPNPWPTTEEGAWARSRDRYTRRGEIYDRLATHAFVSAIYQAPEVREARVRRLGTWLAMNGDEVGRLVAAERAEGDQYDDFIVSLFTVERSANDLDARATMWRVALVVEGEGEVLPASIDPVQLDRTLRQLYPTVGDFDLVYRVRFPRVKTPLVGRKFMLLLASAEGRVQLDWGKSD
jgi:hypothetical protein